MIHILPNFYKRIFILQMMVLLSFVIMGILVFPFILLAYVLLYQRNKLLYRAIVNRLCYLVWIHFTYIAQWWNGLKLRLYIKQSDIEHIGKEHALIIMNHKYDIDWVTTWIFAEKFGVLGGGQSFAKSSLKWVPVLGWIWNFNGTIFLDRDFHKDKEVISKNLKGFSETIEGYYHVLLIYPEGTRFTRQKLESSNEVARSKGMPELKHCLLPRSRGFVEVVKSLRTQVNVIYNLTVAFPDNVNPTVSDVNTHQPGFTMRNILNATVKEGNLFCERILMKDLPHEEEELTEWLHELFRKKDALFDQYVNTGKFPGHSMIIEPPLIGLVINCITFLLIWTMLGSWLLHAIWVSSWLVRLIIFGFIITTLVAIQLVMGITQSEKGSSYGIKKSH